MEERLNAITHGVGAVLALVALVVLTAAASIHGTAWHIVSFAVFGTTLLLLYTASTLYHSARGRRLKRLFQRLDHTSIYLLIAGTYTPFALVALHGALGWTVFGVIWLLAAGGIVVEACSTKRHEVLVTSFYLLMGWLAVFTLKPLVAALPGAAIAWLVIGGVVYSVGAVIYLLQRIPYNHAVWHLFVLGGSAAHFVAVLFYVLPMSVR